MSLYNTGRERKSKKKTQNVLDQLKVEKKPTKCNSLKAPLKQFLGGPDRTMQALQIRPHTGTYKTAK